MLDLVLAIAHHVLIFGIFGILFAEFVIVRPGMQIAALRAASMDAWYGTFAGAVLVIGFYRAVFAAKGWAYYSHNAFFWAKIRPSFSSAHCPCPLPSRSFAGERRASRPTTMLSGRRAVICTWNSRSSSCCLSLLRPWHVVTENGSSRLRGPFRTDTGASPHRAHRRRSRFHSDRDPVRRALVQAASGPERPREMPSSTAHA